MKKTLITSILIISFTPALGNAETGDDLLKYTKSANKVMSGDNASTKIDYLKAGQLLGFVTGVVDSLNAVDFCISPEVKKRVWLIRFLSTRRKIKVKTAFWYHVCVLCLREGIPMHRK